MIRLFISTSKPFKLFIANSFVKTNAMSLLKLASIIATGINTESTSITHFTLLLRLTLFYPFSYSSSYRNTRNTHIFQNDHRLLQLYSSNSHQYLSPNPNSHTPP